MCTQSTSRKWVVSCIYLQDPDTSPRQLLPKVLETDEKLSKILDTDEIGTHEIGHGAINSSKSIGFLGWLEPFIRARVTNTNVPVNSSVSTPIDICRPEVEDGTEGYLDEKEGNRENQVAKRETRLGQNGDAVFKKMEKVIVSPEEKEKKDDCDMFGMLVAAEKTTAQSTTTTILSRPVVCRKYTVS
eukprot:gene1156-524_t